MNNKKYKELPEPNLPNTKEILTKEIVEKTGRKYIIKLNYNENKFGCSKKVNKNIKLLSPHIYPEYIDNNMINSIENISKIGRDNVFFSNGSDSILDHIPKIWGLQSKKSNVIIPSLTYGRIEVTCKMWELNIKKIDLNNWEISLEKTLKHVDKNTSIIYIVNPNMPTGSFIEHNKIVWFLEQLKQRKYNPLVVIDEAYIEFAKGIKQSYIDDKYIIDNYDNVIITRTFSKLYAIASFRIGYCFSSKNNIDILRKTFQYLPVSKYSYQAACAVLSDIQYYRNILEKIDYEKKYLYDELSKIGIRYKESFGNYIFLDLSNEKFTNKQVENFLINNYGLLIRPIKDFAIRVTIGTRKENTILINGLKEFLKNESK